MSTIMGRVLALDLGQVRIGVACSDALGITAQPLDPVKRVGPRKDLNRIADLARELEVTTVVVGYPLQLSGEEGTAAEGAREFSELLGRRLTGVEIELWDERLTTVEAQRTMIDAGVRRDKRKQVVDGLAASLILQGFLTSREAAGSDGLG